MDTEGEVLVAPLVVKLIINKYKTGYDYLN